MRSCERRSKQFSGRALIVLFVAQALYPSSHNTGLFGSSLGSEEAPSRKPDPARSCRINAEGLRLMDRGQIGRAVEKFRLAVA